MRIGNRRRVQQGRARNEKETAVKARGVTPGGGRAGAAPARTRRARSRGRRAGGWRGPPPEKRSRCRGSSHVTAATPPRVAQSRERPRTAGEHEAGVVRTSPHARGRLRTQSRAAPRGAPCKGGGGEAGGGALGRDARRSARGARTPACKRRQRLRRARGASPEAAKKQLKRHEGPARSAGAAARPSRDAGGCSRASGRRMVGGGGGSREGERGGTEGRSRSQPQPSARWVGAVSRLPSARFRHRPPRACPRARPQGGARKKNSLSREGARACLVRDLCACEARRRAPRQRAHPLCRPPAPPFTPK